MTDEFWEKLSTSISKSYELKNKEDLIKIFASMFPGFFYENEINNIDESGLISNCLVEREYLGGGVLGKFKQAEPTVLISQRADYKRRISGKYFISEKSVLAKENAEEIQKRCTAFQLNVT